MKRILSAAALILLLTLCLSACASAAEIRPLEAAHQPVDLNNGRFCLAVKDVGRIDDGGYFTASLYLEDHYGAAQIESMAPGDSVLVNGRVWTVSEVIPHAADAEPGLVDSYEICTEEESDGYIAFLHADDGCYLCVVNDWTPVFHAEDVRIMLPLADQFSYSAADGDDPVGAEGFLDALREYGDSFLPYNTFCTFRDGMLVSVSHLDYPAGPEPEAAEETASEAETAEAVPVWKFCHGRREGLETAVIKGYQSDCEAGPYEIEMTAEEIEDIRDLAINGVITGKANDLSVTGGTWFYSFETAEGEHLLTVELYKGWIVDSATGMYTVSR